MTTIDTQTDISAAPIRVFIVDDHEIVRSGLATLLEVANDLELVGEASSGEEALVLCAKTQPDVILLDMVMPSMDGPSTAAGLREACPSAKILALTSFPEEGLIQRALEAGVLGYLLKNVGAAELTTAIRAARQGKPTLSPEATMMLMQRANRPPAVGHDLSPREMEVLKLMTQGLSNRLIAENLVISPSTADFHVSNILGKLSAATRTEAVAIALQHKLIE
jgi:NarL family two-component system response regulator LiaR